MKRLTAVLMLALGLAMPACAGVGGVDGRAAGVTKAAGALEKDVHAANVKLKELSEVLKAAGGRFSKKEYPADLASTLPGLVIPFDAASLDHRELTDFPRKTMQSLLAYTMEVQALNAGLDKFKNLLTLVQPVVEKAWREEKEPIVSFSVIFRPEGQKGMMAELVPNKDPFKLDRDFPKEYTVVAAQRQDGQVRAVERKAKRWERGDLTGADPIAIPISPDSTAFFTDKALAQLRVKLVEQIETLTGRDKGTPQETPGLIQRGEEIEADLHKIAAAK